MSTAHAQTTEHLPFAINKAFTDHPSFLSNFQKTLDNGEGTTKSDFSNSTNKNNLSINPIIIAIPEYWFPFHDKTILARYDQNAGTLKIQFQIKKPPFKVKNDNIIYDSYFTRYLNGRFDHIDINYFNHFYQTASLTRLKTGAMALYTEQRFYFYSLEQSVKVGKQTFKMSPILETTTSSSSNFEQSTTSPTTTNFAALLSNYSLNNLPYNIHSAVNPLMLGTEWSWKANKEKNKMQINFRITGGMGMGMHNFNVKNLFPAVNSGILIAF